MRTKHLLSIQALSILAIASASAQADTAAPREQCTIGAFAGYGITLVRSAFSVERDGSLSAASDCGRFEHGSAGTPIVGLTAEMPVTTRLRGVLDAQYQRRDGSLRFPCVDPAGTRLPNGTVTTAITDHVAAISASSITTRLSLSWQPLDAPFYVKAGPALAVMLPTARYDAHEEIVSPSNAEFVTGGQVLQYGSGDFHSRLSLGVAASVTYHAPIAQRWMLAPELAGIVALNDEIPDAGLRTHTLQATLGLLYRFERTPEPVVTPPPIVAVIPPPKHDQGPALNVVLAARALRPDGTPTDTLEVEQTGVVKSRLYPLLTYLFFDEGDAIIPKRYIQRTPSDARGFSEERLRDLGTLGIYYNLLDIIGLRMRRYPAATITVTGTQPDAPQTGDKLRLAGDRADRVRQYLVDVWGLDPARITTTTRQEPTARSNPDTKEGAAENRRAEITSSTYEITEPLLLADTSAESIAPSAWLDPRVSSEAGIDSWRVVVGGGPKRDAIFQGSGFPPAHLELPHDFISEAAATRPAVFTMQLTVLDHAGQEITDSTMLPLRWVDKLSDIRFGSGTYSLILFDFNSAQLRPEHLRTIDLVNARTDTSAHAGIFGYTDVLGSDDQNQVLSQQRAASVAGRIHARIDQVAGRGETTLLYDNALPEGRFYSRTVTIETTTP